MASSSRDGSGESLVRGKDCSPIPARRVASEGDRGVDLEGDRDFVLDCHCRTNAACENPAVPAAGYAAYRDTWLSTGQPEEFLEALRSSLDDPRTFARVILSPDGDRIGWVWARCRDVAGYGVTLCEIDDIYVDAAWRRRGTAAMDIGMIEAHARRIGAALLRSGTGASNEASRAMHEKAGFRVSRYEYEKILVDASPAPPDGLRIHAVTIATRTLRGLPVLLRPMTEQDWGCLLAWNNDPEVLCFAEEDDVRSRPLEDVQSIYRETSQRGLVFVIEVRGAPVGECWLQAMNLPVYEAECRGRDCRRIDIAIGDKAFWGRGVGTAAVAALTRHGFEVDGADAIYLCGVADYNVRSLAVARRLGFREVRERRQLPGGKARVSFDYRLRREEYEGDTRAGA